MWSLARSAIVAAVCAAWALAPLASQAALVSWDINPAESSLSLNVLDQAVPVEGVGNVTIRLRSAGSTTQWVQGRTAAMDGTISTNYVDGTSIKFLSGLHDAFGLVSGDYRPNPGAFNPANTNAENPDGQFSNTTLAPAVFGARVRGTFIISFDVAYLSFLDVSYDIASGVLPLAGTSFNSAALTLGVDSATVALDGLATIAGQVVPDTDGTQFTNIFGPNGNAGGTVTTPDPFGDPLLRRLAIPVNVPLTLTIGEGAEAVNLAATATGSIVAYALVPEPTTLVLLASGLAGLAIRGRRRA